jgi:PAS domain S-box-containing protein
MSIISPQIFTEQRWQAVFENSAVGIGLTDVSGSFLAANPVLQRMLGYTEEELRAISIIDVTLEEDREHARSRLAQLQAGRLHNYRLERRYLRRDGGVIWANTSVSIIPGTVNTRPMLVRIVEDITERKKAEAESHALKDELAAELIAMTRLHELSTRLLSNIELQPLLEEVLQATIEMQKADFGDVQLYNPETQSLEIVAHCGFKQDFLAHLSGICGDSSISGRSLQRQERVIIEDVEADPVIKQQQQIAVSAGYRAVQSTPLFSRKGEPLGVISTHFSQPHRPSERELRLTDLYAMQGAEMIERKRVEAALQKLQGELAHVTRVTTMGELTASIAHEINQPLGAIVTNGQICLRLLARESPDIGKMREVVERMISDSLRASEVVTRIRGMLKRKDSERALLNLNEIIQEVIALTTTELNKSEIHLQTSLAADLPAVVGDRVQLQQVILNLILNSKDSMSGVGWHPRELLITTMSGISGEVLVTFRDSGTGVDPRDRERIFDPFFTTKSEGMGLGLSISRTIIESHGGSLCATPNEQIGTTIQIILPT